MNKLKDDLLLHAYYKAIELNFEQDFIMLLRKEIYMRKIDYRLEKFQHREELQHGFFPTEPS
ncbi:sporulation histidine kinase inhibitor Sda [Alkalihalobacillus deserti]|uniref:sporulation histidine kinase inhibitor Sda n=1 Tax=Alkalihalobacillus deserti TaxID=2879466 RepID=UPI001D146B65|nr:sporulation histidine kinase inhibitor Sda [Alkalihalobacillus deserti]